MQPLIETRRAEVAELCRKYHVRQLEAFGSATTGAFDPQRSDFDFLVQFDPDPSNLFKRYFGLKESLEAMFDRDVDLVMIGALRNPYFIEAVNKTRQLVYAAEDAQAA